MSLENVRDESFSREESSAAAKDRVVVNVKVVRTVLEPRTDVDGVEDFYEIDRRIVSEREWVAERSEALRADARV